MKFIEKENKLAAELKQLCVETKDGKWEENKPKQSAEILHKIGLLYKEKSPNKLCLIRSCALLKSAIVRNPSNVQRIKKDLDRLCTHLLKIANVDQSFTNLSNISEKVAEKVKKLRENTEDKLLCLKHIPYEVSEAKLKELEWQKIQTVCNIQDYIFSQYTYIMQFIAEKCVEIMGKPPHKFAIAGMGSLARKEITPYSDFEHIILLDDNKSVNNNTLNYFRWFSVIFHFIIIMLGETIIPSVAIPSLNDFTNENSGDWFFDSFTKRGISFDGMMPHACKFPLGRQEGTTKKPWSTELIQPVKEMIKYLDYDVDLKNGYHLSDVLKCTSFVYGDNIIYKQYCDLVKQKLKTKYFSKNKSDLFQKLTKIDFTPNKISILDQKFNIKQTLYRNISLFLTIICNFHNEFATGFKAIDNLNVHKIIDSSTSHHLKYALSIACEVRLKLYTKKQGQADYIDKGKTFRGLNDYDPAQELVQAVEEASLVRYFEILLCLIKAQGEDEFLSYIYIPDHCISSSVYWCSLHELHQNERITLEWEKRKSLNWLKNDLVGYEIKYIVCNAYRRMKNYQAALKLVKQTMLHIQPKHKFFLTFLGIKMECLFYFKAYKQMETISQPFLKKFPIPDQDFGIQLRILEIYAYSKAKFKKIKVALSIYLQHLNIDECILLNYPLNMINFYRGIGECYEKLKNNERGIFYYNKAQTLLNKLTVKQTLAQHSIYLGLHLCYKALGKEFKAIKYAILADEISKQFSPSEKMKLCELPH